MFSRDEHREKLKQEAKNALFDQEFAAEVERQIAEKQANKGKSLLEKMKLDSVTQKNELAPRFKIDGDDSYQTLMWRSLMKDCAFYYDVPTLDDELKMRRTLQRKYDDLFQENWRPPLTSRRDLLTWACRQYNGSLEARDVDQQNFVDCENYQALIFEFGPDYNRLKGKLGYIRGLFD